MSAAASELARKVARWGSPNARELQFAWRYLTKCRLVLDVACGTGDFIACRPQGTLGIDINDENLAHCRSRGLNVQHGDALALPFADGSFDGVHSAQVMFVFDSGRAVRYLRELSRVTRPGGTIVIATLCDPREVFNYPEVARPWPPGAIYRMIHPRGIGTAKGGTEIEGIEFQAILFRRPPLINFRLSASPSSWRIADLLNAIQFGCGLRKPWAYRGYTMVLTKACPRGATRPELPAEPVKA